MQPVVSLISLGCPKNTVDSERLLAGFLKQGFLLAEAPDEADVCLVNTCGFIENARIEVRDVLEELDALKTARGDGGPLVVAVGCLVEHAQRHGLDDYLGKADLCVGFGDYMRLPQRCLDALARRAEEPPVEAGGLPSNFADQPRVITGSGHSVSLKISEGCSNACSFCAIPGIRGRQVSRPVEAVLAEARQLMAAGARELNVIAQDSSAYGLDLYGRHELGRLLRELAKCDWDGWVRVMYVSPANLRDDVLDVLADDPRFCRYVDMPLQHIADDVLRRMNRRVSGDDIRRLLDHIRARVDGVALRTAFIVGFPGETEKQFEQLHAFVEEQHFDHLGVFTYSPEPGTAAGKLVDDVPAAVKQQRFDVLMQTQQQISDARLAQRHGQMVEVMLDGYQTFGDEEEACELLTGHTQGQALDIDGCVIVEEDAGDDKTFEPGQRVMVRITDHTPYDLIGRCGRSVPLRCGASVAEHEDSGRSVPLRCDANEIPERDAPGTMQNPERDAPGTMGLKGEDV